jgi:DNA-binding CsgD family transcriptional regulator
VIPLVLARLVGVAFARGQIPEGFALLRRARAAAEATGDSAALVEMAIHEGFNLASMGSLGGAERVWLRGLRAARRAGLGSWFRTAVLVNNAAEAMWCRGRTAEAAVLIDPLTTGAPRADDWKVHLTRALLDMMRGDHAAAAARQRQVHVLAGRVSSIEMDREAAHFTTEMALWAGRPGDALQQARQALARYEGVPELTDGCGALLAAGLRACADLAEQARARRDHGAACAAQDAAGELACWLQRTAGVPFTDHSLRARIPADRATWDAEQTRLAGSSDPGAWHAAAKTWEHMGWPHRAGYAWWRQAQAQLDAGHPAAAAAPVLRAAAAAADGHEPLLAQIRALAQRARIGLQAPPAAPGQSAPEPGVPTPYGLTERELLVLRLVGAGRTNAQIGAELYISPRTAGVHVTNILRKLGVSSRVQTAALAERAGLLPAPAALNITGRNLNTQRS